MRRKKTINEIASERQTELWREFYEKNPDKWSEVLDAAKQAKRFLKKLASFSRSDR